MTLDVYHTGAWQSGAPYVYHGGSWQVALSVSAYRSGSWQTVAQILSSATVTNDGFKANGAPVTLGLNITGGYGTLTYSWSRTAFTPGSGNITGSTTGATVDITGGTNADGEFTCVITDSLTGGTTNAVGTITWGTPP